MIGSKTRPQLFPGAPRDRTGRFLRTPVRRQLIPRGKIYDLVKELLGDAIDTVEIARNLVVGEHTDKNVGFSYVLHLGEFRGGTLVFATGERVVARGAFVEFDGRVQHWTEPIVEGTKTTLAAYRRSACSQTDPAPSARVQGPLDQWVRRHK